MRISDLPMLSEIKNEYIRCRQNGSNRHEATYTLIEKYVNELVTGVADDSLVFWIGLADGQYSQKELTTDVAQNALHSLDQIELLDWEITPRDISLRRTRYAEAPMPERKIRKSEKYRCSWKIGDTFAYLLSGEETDACGLSGKYVLLRKVDELEFGDGRLLPVVTFTIWDDHILPSSAEEFRRNPILRLVSGRFGLSFNVHEYRAELLIKSQKSLDKLQLIYLGNFMNIPMPPDELIIRNPGRVMLVIPEQLNQDCCAFWRWHNRSVN